MLFLCKNAQEIWKASPIQWDGLGTFKGNFWLSWESLMEATNRDEGKKHIEARVYILWHIWKARNEVTFKNKVQNPAHVAQKAMAEWLEYQKALEDDQGQEDGSQRR